MPKIKITHATLESTATQIANCAAKQANVLNLVDKAIRDLNNGWEGEAQKAFSDVYEKAKPTYKSFADDIRKFSDFLKEYLRTMQDADVRGGKTMG